MKKGFTLIELIAVVAILAVIAIIAGISYTSINSKHKKDSCESLKKQFQNAAIEYVQDKHLIRSANRTVPVNYNDLISNGYMEEGLKNPYDDSNIDTDMSINVTRDSNSNYSATADINCGVSNE